MRACVVARMGRIHDAIGIIRADQGPMLDAHRQLANGGTMTVLAELYTVAGDAERARFWMRAVRDIDLPHSIQFRQPRFAELAGSLDAYLSLPASELIDENPAEIQRRITEALDDVEARLSAKPG